MTSAPRTFADAYTASHGLAFYRMPQIVQAYIVNSGFLPRPVPHIQVIRTRFWRIERRQKHVSTAVPSI